MLQNYMLQLCQLCFFNSVAVYEFHKYCSVLIAFYAYIFRVSTDNISLKRLVSMMLSIDKRGCIYDLDNQCYVCGE